VPVVNSGPSDATNVEVVVESVERLHPVGDFVHPSYLPGRLLWTHSKTPECTRVVGKSYRLLDFAIIGLFENVHADRPLLSVCIEDVLVSFKCPVGTYRFTFVLTSSCSASVRESWNITLRENPKSEHLSLSDYLAVVRP